MQLIPSRSSVTANLRWGGRFWLMNALLLTLLLGLYRLQMPDGADRWTTSLYLAAAQLSQGGAFALLAAVALTSLCWLPGPLFRGTGVALACVTTASLLADTQVFAHYRFHINGFILEMLVKGGSQIFQVSWVTWSWGALALLAIIGLQRGAAILAHRPLPAGGRAPLLGVWLCATLGAHLYHALADARYDTQLTATGRYLPLYYPLTARRTLERWGWVDLDQRREEAARLARLPSAQDLNYPQRPLGEARATPNLLVVVIDAWRADALTPTATPNLHRLSQGGNSQVFRRHFSGGNSTQAGMFSLFYGLPATYWEGFVHARRRPVMMETLDSLGYQLGIFQSATIVSPAFDRTLYQGIAGLAATRPGDSPAQRDAHATEGLLRFLAERDPSRPFFGLLFLDSVHGYDFPEEAELPYPDYLKRVDHLALDNDFDPTPYHHRYLNAAHYADQLAGSVLAQLQRQGLMEETIVVVTADHGEEFNDNHQNYWGHGSNYSAAQLQVPLVIHWPGQPHRQYERRTSHLDLVPTLLQAGLGIDTDAGAYSEGGNLFRHHDHPWLVAASYSDYALVGESAMMVVQPTGLSEVLRNNLTPAPGTAITPEVLMKQLKALSRFYR